jgi:predicted Zn-dependent protease
MQYGLTRAFHILALCVCLSLAACSSRKVVPVGEIPKSPPPSLDQVQTARALVEGQMGVPSEALYVQGPSAVRVRRIVSRLAQAANFGSTKIPVYVVDAGDDANAMAVNGGAIVVFERLVERVPSDDQLAAVLGHEVAHMISRHHEDEGEEERETGVSIFSTVLGTAAAVAVGVATGSSSAGNFAGNLAGSTSQVIGEGAIVKSYSRDMEYEADHVGLMLMTKAGYDPRAAIEFWQNANIYFGEDLSGSSFLSTHPSGPERIEALHEALPLAEKYRRRR